MSLFRRSVVGIARWLFDEEMVASFGADVPLGRPGQPEEVALSYVFLASDDSSYMTGQVLHPNGGEVING